MALKKSHFQAQLLCAVLAASSPVWVPSTAFAQASATNNASDPSALFDKASEAFASKEYETAASTLNTLYELVKENKGAPLEMLRFNIGLAYLLDEKYPEAEKAFAACVAQFPKGEYTTRAYLGLGRACAAQATPEKYKLAIDALRTAAADPEYRTEAGLSLGNVYMETDRNDEALQVFRTLMGSDVRTPQQTNAAVSVVTLLARTEKLDDLVSYLDRLINQPGVRDAIAWYANQVIVEGDQLISDSDYAGALALYRSIPPRYQILETQGRSIEKMKDEVKDLEEKVKKESAKPIEQRSTTLSEKLSELKNSLDLTTQAKKAIEDKTDLDAALLMRRGRALYYLDRYEEALLCFRTIRTKYPTASDAETAAYSEIFVYTQLKDSDHIQKLAMQFLEKYPKADNLEQVALIAGDGLAQARKWPELLKFYQDLEARFPESPNLDRYKFYEGVAMFQDGQFKQAAALFSSFQKDFPNSELLEDAIYRVAMANFLTGEYKETLAACENYLRRYPEGKYAGDVHYRLSFIDFQDKEEDQSDKIIKDLNSYIDGHPEDVSIGSMLTLIGDVYDQKKKGAEDKALEYYIRAIWASKNPEVTQYAIDTATSILQKKKDWDGIANLHAEIMDKMKGSQLALISSTWVAKMKLRQGKGEEAAELLAKQLKNTIGDPTNEQVEFLIDQLVSTLVPRSRKQISETNMDELMDKLVGILDKAAEGQESPTTTARIYYARARLAESMRNKEQADLYLKGIATTTPDPAALSPALLAVSGEILLKDGDLDKAEAMFQRLTDRYKDSSFADAGPVGLGRVALARGENDKALELFQDTLANNPGMSRYREAKVGELEALTKTGKLEEAEKLATEITGDKQFRGIYIPQAYMLWAEIYRKYGDQKAGTAKVECLRKAHAYYQRVYSAYKAYPEVCAEAYWDAYEVLGELGETEIATKTLQQLADEPKLKDTERAKQAKKLLP
ncbi:tetratricopeptide repeat protein [Luteolibacter pohnpeiensis]|uniref:Tetratricopeptide repeat protein n=1 Tax=Luteolibacter pohnpeiensis TaxID=454153 RepID=A0A934S9J4_9BACT|nr:tetratricopeptide repeat protein [Luteolibacter pohnpeiensis]MBK1881844.1 tetratricopeptide repeat protein [Luteolibacter pohnpeiensis]